MTELVLSSREEFENKISRGVALVDFFAPWCGPCRAQEAAIQMLGQAYDGKAEVASVNIDAHREIAITQGIQSIPTIIVFKSGREIKRYIGLQTLETLRLALAQALLDDEINEVNETAASHNGNKENIRARNDSKTN